jgi:hypothetical protein
MDITALFTAAATGVTDGVGDAATVALPAGATILALFVGWRVLKRLVNG